MRSTAIDLPVGPLASFVCSIMRDYSLQFTSLISWSARRFRPVLFSSIVENRKLFDSLSSTIVLKDRGVVSGSSFLSNWTFEMRAEDEIVCSFSWILLYRASISGYRAADLHRAFDGLEKCVVIVKAENGRIAVTFNEDGFTSIDNSTSPNLNGFIVSVVEESRCGEIFHRNDQSVEIWNDPKVGPDFGDEYGIDLCISVNCDKNDHSFSELGGAGVDPSALFGQRRFQVVDYEVFKLVIE
jgi:hypothetical protein